MRGWAFLQLSIAERVSAIAMTEGALHDFDALVLRVELAAARMPQLVRWRIGAKVDLSRRTEMLTCECRRPSPT